jgi:hypothetical protein
MSGYHEKNDGSVSRVNDGWVYYLRNCIFPPRNWAFKIVHG